MIVSIAPFIVIHSVQFKAKTTQYSTLASGLLGYRPITGASMAPFYLNVNLVALQ